MIDSYSLVGDIFNLLPVVYLLLRLFKNISCGGISAKTQLLLAVVYASRCLDSYYEFCSNVTRLILCSVTIILIFTAFRQTYRQTEDTFFTEVLLVPSFVLALWVNYGLTEIKILRSFGIFLETVATLPQFYMILKRREVEKGLLHYIVSLEVLYILGWIYYHCRNHRFDEVIDSAGVVHQTSYLVAFVIFCVLKVKVTKDEVTEKNLRYISSNQPILRF